MTKTMKRKLRKARDFAVSEAGGPHSLGKMLGITGQAVSQWEIVPEGRVNRMSRLLGIPKHNLRPDIHRPEADA